MGYPHHFICRVLSDVKRKHFSYERQPRSPFNKPTLVLPHNEFTSNFIRPIMTSNNINVVHPASNTIRSNVVRTKPPRVEDVGDGAGVYVVRCKDCEDVYVGETG